MQPQQQMMPQNNQIPNANQPAQNQMYQVIQTESQNTFEKCSKCITGSANVPFMVFIIIMSSFAVIAFFFLCYFHPIMPYFFTGAIFDFLFALFVWCRMAIKIEKNTSTVKYGYLYFLNLFILSICTLNFPLFAVWSFILFETILIALNNRDKKMKFFCCRITGKKIIIFSILYYFLFNWFSIIRLIIIVAYSFIYNKYLSKILNISNANVQKLENTRFIKYFKGKFLNFISIDEIQNKDKKEQPLVNPQQQDISNSVMSFDPSNIYPNYYSGNFAAPGQQIQGNNIPPVVDINQAN